MVALESISSERSALSNIRNVLSLLYLLPSDSDPALKHICYQEPPAFSIPRVTSYLFISCIVLMFMNERKVEKVVADLESSPI